MSKTRKDGDFIGDILEAMERISLYIKDLTCQKFLEDRKTQDAVVRNFEIIGEAAKNLSSDFKAQNASVPWKKISGLRDKLIHFYFGVDNKIVWSIAKKELPHLYKTIRSLLTEEV